jgi:glutathione S-transferase
MSSRTVVGSPISPFVRKVVAALDLKALDFRIDPIPAFYTDERLLALNPLRRVPVLLDGAEVIVDSSVIVQWLEESHPATPSILPKGPSARARARFVEEYADTRMADVFLWKVFNAVILKPGVWGEPRDLDAYRAAIEGPVADVCDDLERMAPREGFLFDAFSIADLSVCVMFRNMRFARFTPDAARWPRLAAWIAFAEAHTSLARVNAWADALIKAPVAELRATAAAVGMPLAEKTLFVDGPPRPGPMTVRP